jgi:DNA-binding NarL/FixJ family response regulator
VIGEAANTKELLDLISSHHPDVVIFDYFSEHNFLPEDIQAVKRISPKTNFLIISADEKNEYLQSY